MTEQEFRNLCRRSETFCQPGSMTFCVVHHAGRLYPAEFIEIRDGLLFVKVDRQLAVFPQGVPRVDTLLAPLAEFSAHLMSCPVTAFPKFEVR